MTTLFDTEEFTVQPRAMDGKFTGKSHQHDINRLRLCCIAEVRRKESVYRQLHEMTAEIQRLKELLKCKFKSIEEMDNLAKLFS